LPSALVRMPGTPASAAYTEDAYLQTRAGHGARALGVALLGSVIGGVVGAVVLMVAAPLLAEFALQFTSYEYFWVAVLGLTASVIISAGSQVKGAISLLIGLLLATVGIDRSEEHTSELQSRENLVCRLLLETKNSIK